MTVFGATYINTYSVKRKLQKMRYEKWHMLKCNYNKFLYNNYIGEL